MPALAPLLALALSTPATAPVSAPARSPGTTGLDAAQAAGINHCIGSDGHLLYTDKPCASLGGQDLGNAGPLPGIAIPAYRNACIGSLREFAFALSSAIEVGDVNRLAELYRWKGTSTRSGYEVMDRLEEIASRPLLQVEPVYAPPPPAPGSTMPAQPLAPLPASAASMPAAAAPVAPVAPVPPPAMPSPPADDDGLAFDGFAFDPLPHGPPVALRLDQTLANGVTPAPTTLYLRRELGCWWVSL